MEKPLQPHGRFSRMMRLTTAPFILSFSCLTFAYAAPDRDLLEKNTNVRLEEKAVDKTISGKVVDETNSGLPGVSIVIKGTQRGTVTDGNGLYKLEVPDNATLIFSFVGYVPQEIAVGNQSSINLTLKSDSKVLEEIVVIGYGTLRKSDLTGSVSTVKADQLMERPAPSLAQQLSCRMARVQINTT